jgi:dolichol-phosphate mannosyltransferase
VIYLLVLRLVYLGQIELAPQEAYYWNYAQHLDIGYLDHPPLVAWLIAATSALGEGEFFVRLPAVLCWAVMLAFAVAYAQDMAGRGNALRCALLAATLPFCFGIGVMITPDAPLAAAWAAALFFLQRALLGESKVAWLGAGLAIGIGMLAKYSMVLVPAAAFVFMLVDARSRRSLLSAWAWGRRTRGAAGVLAGHRLEPPARLGFVRFSGFAAAAARATQFSLPEFLAAALLLLTPLGVLALWRCSAPAAA